MVVDVSPSSKAMINDIMFTPPGSADLVRDESSEVFAAKDLDFAIDDEGMYNLLINFLFVYIGIHSTFFL